MRRILVLLALVAATYIAINRERLYLRDPLGAMYRNGVKQSGAALFINYSNDVLVQAGSGSAIEEYLVQNWNHRPTLPAEMRCLRGLVCLAEEDHAPSVPLQGVAPATMTNRQVTFKDEAGATFRFDLR